MNKDNKEQHSISLGMNNPPSNEIMSSTLPASINPKHYLDFAITPYEYITKNDLNWEQANATKYLTRYKKKGGKEDLLKAIKYIELLIEREYR